jgi:hypothetical protein
LGALLVRMLLPLQLVRGLVLLLGTTAVHIHVRVATGGAGHAVNSSGTSYAGHAAGNARNAPTAAVPGNWLGLET